MVVNGSILGTEKDEKGTEIFHCEKCDFFTSHIGHWKRHLKTKKHNDSKMVVNDSKNEQKGPQWICHCGRQYKYDSGYYRHKKKCKWSAPTSDTPTDQNQVIEADSGHKNTSADGTFFDSLSKEELKGICKFQQLKISEGNGSTQAITGDNNTMTNQNFNISVFLNEQCRDAMSIQDFAKQLTLTMEDLAASRQNRAQGFSNIMVKNLEPLAITERPVHCTEDQAWFIKDGSNWSEDNGSRLVQETQRGIQRSWPTVFQEANPDWKDKEGLQGAYVELAGATTTDLSQREISKITKTVGKKCHVKDD